MAARSRVTRLPAMPAIHAAARRPVATNLSASVTVPALSAVQASAARPGSTQDAEPNLYWGSARTSHIATPSGTVQPIALIAGDRCSQVNPRRPATVPTQPMIPAASTIQKTLMTSTVDAEKYWLIFPSLVDEAR